MITPEKEADTVDSQNSLYKALQNEEYAIEFFRIHPLVSLGDSIIALRLGKSFSRAKLAEISNTDKSLLGEVENAAANPTFKTMQQIAEALGCVLRIELVPLKESIQNYAN